MKRILFHPFDAKKWFVIGFCAWLAKLGGGGSFSYRYNRREDLQKLKDAVSQIPQPILVIGRCVLLLLLLALIVVFAWLRARGRFMFLDCIAKNRGAIAEPWREFRRQGNSYFLFSLLVGVALVVFAALVSLPLIGLAIRSRYYFYMHRDRRDVYLISAMAAWVAVILVVMLAWALIANFTVPVMYRHRCNAYRAVRAVTSLIMAYPGETVLYCLFLIALALGTIVVACFATCLTCCIAALPYVGTVILLPVFVVLRSFSVCFLRQFGSDYDVWLTFMPQEFGPVLLQPPQSKHVQQS